MLTETDILVVEDDPLLRLGMVCMLRDMGYQASAAQDAMHALPMLQSGIGIDVLITDYSMPGMTGIELARRMAAQRPDLQVVIMSGHLKLNDELAPEWRRLTKPFTERELRREIEALTSG